ncbi:MAG: nucleotidyl transferase AbiEii/AbiGii toxin family protein [Clostridiaceae bacterium]|nr:nucleotidyl transferase AbiEii/AbiGii toxin family protein [Clostridiaceae bacterium]
MSAIIEEMLKSHNTQTIYDKKNAMKEVIQETVLCGLSRAGFFKKAAFYGGTALRIFYGLDRFSEDLDFSLLSPEADFDLCAYFPILEKEVSAYGLNIKISEKKKTKETSIQSAFLKGNTKEHLLSFYANNDISGVSANETIKIKLEIDINPPGFATFEHKYRLLPAPYEIMLYDVPSLFAGKVHAVICRAWQNRIKGRDLYDYIFYLARKSEVNQKHLHERLLQTGHITNETACSFDEIKQMLFQRFESIDFEQAKSDVAPFIRDTSVLNLWSAEFFKQITEDLIVK